MKRLWLALVIGACGPLVGLAPASTLDTEMFGGGGNDSAMVCYLQPPYLYVAGNRNANFPVTVGAYSNAYPSSRDVFVAKLGMYDLAPLAIAVIGGSGDDEVTSLAFDSTGFVYVMGVTGSTNFPVTAGVYQTQKSGPTDLFVAKFDSSLSSLLAATYLGGSSNEYGVVTFGNGYLYLAGGSQSMDFPVSPDAYDTSFNGGSRDNFVARLDTALSQYRGSLFGGTSFSESATEIRVALDGTVYVAGSTEGFGFPTTVGAVQATKSSFLGDGYISRFNSSLTALLSSTLLGGQAGSGPDVCVSFDFDAQGNILALFTASSADFPITAGAFQAVKAGGAIDGAVSKLNPSLTALLASTFIGSDGSDVPTHLRYDPRDDSVVVTLLSTTGFPMTTFAQSRNPSGNGDFVISRLNNALSVLLASTYLGGSGADRPECVDINPVLGEIYVCGSSGSANWPFAPNPTYSSFAGGTDAVVARLSPYLESLGIQDVRQAGGLFTFTTYGQEGKTNVIQGSSDGSSWYVRTTYSQTNRVTTFSWTPPGDSSDLFRVVQ